MNEKTYISITGPTGAGKSTLLQALSEALSDRSMILPQTTTRLPRSDDMPATFSFVTDEEFREQKFFIAHGQYGVTSTHFDSFIGSEKEIGISVIGANEMRDLCNKSSGDVQYRIKNIMVTYTSSQQEEDKRLQEEVRELFNSAQAEKRFISNKSLCSDFFFNPGFTSQCIHLHLTREDGPQDWARKIVSAFPDLCIDEDKLSISLKNKIDQAARRQEKPNDPPNVSGGKLTPK